MTVSGVLAVMPPFDLLPGLLSGLKATLLVFAGGSCVALLMALIFGLGKLSHNVMVRWLSIAYIEVFRGTSALVQLFWFFYVLPRLGVDIPAIACGMIVLGLNGGAYGAEVVRGAVMAIPEGQYEAAIALNLSRKRTLFKIILPQALIAMMPPFNNILIELLKNTALVSLVTISDLTFRGKVLISSHGREAEVLGLILVIYFALSFIVTCAFRFGERRLTRHLGERASA